MDLASYANRGLKLANLPIGDGDEVDRLHDFVATQFPWWAPDLHSEDLDALKALRNRLRAVLLADHDVTAVDELNALLRDHPVSPQISGHGTGDPDWHMHLSRDGVGVAERIAAVVSMGLAAVLIDAGMDRRGCCGHHTCEDVYIDGSPGGTRRYCSEGCSNRANVAAWRARRKATSG